MNTNFKIIRYKIYWVVNSTTESKYFSYFRVVRTEVPSDLVDWQAPFDTYDTITFSAPHLKTASWADPDIDDENFHPQWNQLDGNINRMSHEGSYLVSNPIRTIVSQIRCPKSPHINTYSNPHYYTG